MAKWRFSRNPEVAVRGGTAATAVSETASSRALASGAAPSPSSVGHDSHNVCVIVLHRSEWPVR